MVLKVWSSERRRQRQKQHITSKLVRNAKSQAHPGPNETETLGAEPSSVCLNKCSQQFGCLPMFEKHSSVRTVHLRPNPLPLGDELLGQHRKGKGAAGCEVWDTALWQESWFTWTSGNKLWTSSQQQLRLLPLPVVGQRGSCSSEKSRF